MWPCPSTDTLPIGFYSISISLSLVSRQVIIGLSSGVKSSLKRHKKKTCKLPPAHSILYITQKNVFCCSRYEKVYSFIDYWLIISIFNTLTLLHHKTDTSFVHSAFLMLSMWAG